MFIHSKNLRTRFFYHCFPILLLLTIGLIRVVHADGIGSHAEESISGLKREPVRTYLIAGQSNADGYALGTGVLDYGNLAPVYDLFDIGREELASVQEMVTMFRGSHDNGSGSWQHLVPGFGIIGNGNRFGPELSFGYAVQDFFGEQIALIKYARGATSLAHDWDPRYPGINQYDYFIETIDNARSEAEATGETLDIVGMVWMQGEDDSTIVEFAENYQNNLVGFIASVRQDLALPELEIYIGTIADSTVWSYRDTIWSAQQQVAIADAGVLLVDGKDLPLLFDDGTGADYVHYSTQGQVELGERFAAAAVDFGIAPTASFKHSCSNQRCNFIDGSTDTDGTITYRAWSFGDGEISNQQNPVHSYASDGTYMVSLTVTDNQGATDSNSHLVYVKDPELAMQEVASVPVVSSLKINNAVSGWVELNKGDLVSSWENDSDGGGEASHYLSNEIDVHTPGYTRIKIDFLFKTTGMDLSSEGFRLQFYDGSNWQTVADYFLGKDFRKRTVYSKTVILDESSYTFPTDMKIRFISDAGIVNIDEIRISGYVL